MAHSEVVIVGSGHAGAQAAISLRQLGFQGRLTILTEEHDYPYERPPLSKDYLSGNKTFDRILIRPQKFWSDKSVDFRFGFRVAEVEPLQRSVKSSDGQEWAYTHLVWACGGHARKLSCPGSDFSGIHSIRSRADVDGLARELTSAERVAIVGGGYIGLEAAAVLVKAKKQVCVIEAQNRVLSRVAGEPLSRFYEAEHRAHGVQVMLGRQVSAVEGLDGKATGVRLDDGELLAADLVIVGIGIIPCVEPLVAAGASGDNGVDVDEFCRTTLPNIYAIGDCASHINVFGQKQRIRLESVQNATDQAMTAARAIIGNSQPYVAVPWFWSNQYDIKLQTIGLSSGYDSLVVRGDPASRAFSVVYLRSGAIIALDCVNAVSDYAQGRRLVMDRASVPKEKLEDVRIPLKQLIAE